MKRGEIWNVNFNPSKGDEISKIRPAVIISSNVISGLRIKVIVPITDARKNIRAWHTKLNPSKSNGLNKESVADCNQIKSVSNSRFEKKLGIVNEDELSDIEITIMSVLELIK